MCVLNWLHQLKNQNKQWAFEKTKRVQIKLCVLDIWEMNVLKRVSLTIIIQNVIEINLLVVSYNAFNNLNVFVSLKTFDWSKYFIWVT